MTIENEHTLKIEHTYTKKQRWLFYCNIGTKAKNVTLLSKLILILGIKWLWLPQTTPSAKMDKRSVVQKQ